MYWSRPIVDSLMRCAAAPKSTSGNAVATPVRTSKLVTRDPAGHAVAVEAVILGNLPGLSGPWLTQYAQLLAQQEGPVAILHVDDDLIDLETQCVNSLLQPCFTPSLKKMLRHAHPGTLRTNQNAPYHRHQWRETYFLYEYPDGQ